MTVLARETRRRTILGARLFFNEGRSTMDCMVRNMSDNGAGLKMPSTVGVPDTFTLQVLGKDLCREVEVRWRKADAMGVRFVDRQDAAENVVDVR